MTLYDKYQQRQKSSFSSAQNNTPGTAFSAKRAQNSSGSFSRLKLSGVPNISNETAIQRLQRREETPARQNWYAGEQPTGNETLARIYDISQTDPVQGEQLYAAYGQYTNDPASPYYAPYNKPTSYAAQQLAALGYGTENGIDAKFFEEQSWLMNHYRTGASGKPLAPSSTSSPEQNAAYYFYNAMGDYETTQKATTEWEALQEEIAYWAQRDDLNLSYDEIVNTYIDWGKYSTLKRMDEGRLKGTPLELTTPVGYSRDAMQGVYWAARNDGGTGNTIIDGVNYARGVGNAYVEDPKISAKLNPGSEAYHPYVFGTTLNDAAVYFGVSHFEPGWTDANRAAILGGTDETAKKNFYAVETAEETTLKAEEEYAALTGWVDFMIANHPGDPSWLDEGLPSEYTTLKAMDEGRFNGKVVGLNRSVDYRWEDVEAYARQRYAEYEAAPVLSAYVQGVTETLGLQPAVTAQSQQGIDANRDDILHMAAPTISEVGNQTEQRVFSTIGVSRFNDYAGLLSDVINSGDISIPTESVNLYADADYYAADNYTSAVQVLAPYREAVANRDAAQAELDVLESKGELTEEEAARAEALRNTIKSSNATINRYQPDYDLALSLEQETTYQYDMAGRLAGALGIGTPEGYVPMYKLIDEAYRLGGKYETPWGQYTALDTAMDYGASYEEVAAYARNDMIAAQREIEMCESLRDEIVNRGGWIPQDWSDNLRWRQEKRQRDIKDSEYFLLRGEEGFSETAKAETDKVLASDKNSNEYSGLTREIAGIEPNYLTYTLGYTQEQTLNVAAMTPEEKETYMYLVATQGEEAAEEFYNHLIDPAYGVIPVRQGTKIVESTKQLTRDSFVGANLLGTMASLVPFQGLGYVGLATITGQRINPYNPAFAMNQISSTVNSTSVEMINETFKDSPALANVLSFGYNALSSVANSITSAAVYGPLSPTMMAVNAAVGTIADASANGANTFEALAYGTVTALAELWSEEISFGDMEKAFTMTPKTVREFITTVGGNTVKEGATEAFSSLITTVSDPVIMGEASAWSRNVEAYMAEGMSLEDAQWSATFDMIYNIGYEGLIGAVAGGGQTVISALGGLVGNRGKGDAPAEGEADTPVEGETDTPAEPEYGLRHGHTRQDSNVNAPSQEQLSADRGNEPNPNQNIAVSSPSQGVEGEAQAEIDPGSARKTELPGGVENEASSAKPDSRQDTEMAGESEEQAARPENPYDAAIASGMYSYPAPHRAEARPVAHDTGYPSYPSGSQFVVPEENAKQKSARNRLYAAHKVLSSAAGSPRRENKAAAMVGTLNALLEKGNTKKNPVEGAVIKLFERFGDDKTLNMMQSIAIGAAEAGVPDADMASAVVVAAFEQSAAYEVLEQMVREDNYSRDAVELLAKVAHRDWGNRALAVAIKQDAFETRTARREMELISEGALDGIKAYETAYKQARANLATAQQNLETAQAELETAGQNLVTVQSQWVEEPSNDMQQGAVQQATKDVEGKVIVRNQMQQSVAKNEAQEAEAASTLKSQRERAMKSVREQAQQEVAAEVMAEEQAVAEAQAAVQAANQPSQEGVVQSAEDSQAAPVAAEPASAEQVDGETGKQYAKGEPELGLKVKNRPKGKVNQSPPQIIKTLLGKLKVGDAIGTRAMQGTDAEAEGAYDTHAKYVAVRGKHAGRASVLMHEAGHAIADKIGMTATQDMVKKWKDRVGEEVWSKYDPDEYAAEAFAEFFERWMIAEEHARDFAGELFVESFEYLLRKAGIYKDVRKAAIDMRRYIAASFDERMSARVHSTADKGKQGLGEMFRELLNGVVDSTSIAEVVDAMVREQNGGEIPLHQALRQNALLNNHASKRAFNILTEALTDSRWNIIGDSLAKRWNDCRLNAKDMEQFELYCLALHSLDRDGQGKPVFDIAEFTEESRKEFIGRMNSEHPEFAEAEKAFQAFRKEFLQAFLVDTAYISQEAFDRMNAMYEHYVPTRRVKPKAGNKGGNSSSTFTIRKATGSTEDIYSPIESFVEMANSIVNMVSQNNVGLAWHEAYQNNEGLGIFGEQVRADIHQVSVDTKALKEKVGEAIEGKVDDDVLADVIELIGDKQQQWVSSQRSSMKNSIAVQLPSGSTAFYVISEPSLYNLLAGTDHQIGRAWKAIGRMTRGMTAVTTGSNPLFGLPNFFRDFQRSVNYGSWATSYVDGINKWVKAAKDVVQNAGDYQQYVAMGGGGWQRIEAGRQKSINEYRSKLFAGYNKSNMGRTAKWAGQKVWNAMTLSRLNEIIEQTSRYAEYKYGKHDKSTAEGRMKAFNASQDVTADFARKGNSELAATLRQVVPFFNASMQGISQTVRMFSKGERSRLPQRLAKTVVNTALTSAICAGMLLKFMDDDDKEEFAWLSDEMKTKYLYLPNFAPWLLGDAPLIRIPLAQDPLAYAIHSMVTNAVWYGETGDFVIDALSVGEVILDGMNPLSSGTVFQPFIDASKNRTWYGSPIVSGALQYLTDPTLQYTEETPEFFRTIGRLLGVSPLAVEYVVGQYTGYLGQILIPAFSYNKHTGELGGWEAAVAVIRKRFTSDPLVSNDVISSFYDGREGIQGVVDAVNAEKPANGLRRGLTDDEARLAYLEAKDMTSKGGVLYETAAFISDGYKRIDEINADPDLTDEEKYTLTSAVRREMCEESLKAQEAIGAFNTKYVYGDDIVMHALEAGPMITKPTAYEMLDQTFLADADAGLPYMQRAYGVYSSMEKEDPYMLPHPNTSFKYDGITFEIEDEYWDEWTEAYKDGYIDSLGGYTDAQWEALPQADRQKVLKDAHSAGLAAAKEAYKRDHPEIDW